MIHDTICHLSMWKDKLLIHEREICMELLDQCYCALCCSEGHCGCDTCNEPCDCNESSEKGN